MNWLKESLTKAMMYEVDGEAGGGTPAATLDGGEGAGAEGGATGNGDGDGSGGDKKAPDYLSSIPKEFRDNKAFLEHEDLSSFLKKSLSDSEKLEGFDPEKAVSLPTEDTNDEDREAFYQKLGKPESAEGYELDDPNFPEGLERSPELEANLKGWALKANIPVESLKSLVSDYNAHMSEMFISAQEAYDKDVQEKTDALKADKKDGYNEHVLKAQRAINQFDDGGELITLLKDSGLETHPTLMKVFGKIGSVISEDSAFGGGSGSGGKGDDRPKGPDGKPRMVYDSDKKEK